MASERRKYRRINYPEVLRPKLCLEGKFYEVLDLSEVAVRFFVNTHEKPKAINGITGNLIFEQQEVIHIRGKFIRKEQNYWVLFLEEPYQISPSKIMEERLSLIQKFGYTF